MEDLSSQEMAEQNDTIPGRQQALVERLSKAPRVMVGRYELKFEPTYLDDFNLQRAREELRETDENVKEGYRRLRELLKKEPGLVVPDDDEYFIKFLRPCKWYPDSAFSLMKRFYTFRVNYPRVCKDLLPSKEKAVLSSGVLLPLPLRAHDGCRVLIIEGGKRWKPKEVSLEEILKGVMLSLDAAMAEPHTQIAGVRVMLDMDGLALHQVTYFTPSFAGMVVEWVQRCLPCRLKAIHILNQPFIFNMVFALFKPFLHDKLRKRIHFHGTDRSGLIKAIGAKALPKHLGGELDIPVEPVGETLWEYYCTFEEDFEASNKYGYVDKM